MGTPASDCKIWAQTEHLICGLKITWIINT